MNKGDTINLKLSLTLDGQAVGQNDFSEIELTFSPVNRTDTPNVRLTKTNGDIIWDASEAAFIAVLQQETTIKMPNDNRYQIRVIKNDNCISTSIGIMHIGDILSNKILEVD